MSINKSYKHSKSGNFTILSNELINDPNLSFKAKGIFLYFFSKPQGWDVRVDYTASIMQDGETAIYSGLKELETQGYLIRQRFYQNGRVAGMEYHFADDKDFTNITNINQEKLNLEKQGQVIINQEKPNDYIIKKTNNKEYNNKDNKEKNIKKENSLIIKNENKDLQEVLQKIEKYDKTEFTQDKKLNKNIETILNDIKTAEIDIKNIFDDKIYFLFLLCLRHKKTRTGRAIQKDINEINKIPKHQLQDALELWNSKKWQSFQAEWLDKSQPNKQYNKQTQEDLMHEAIYKKAREFEKIFSTDESDKKPKRIKDVDDFDEIDYKNIPF